MIHLLKYTYLLDNKKLKNEVERLWHRYQSLLDKKNITWEEANEARSLLYTLGHLFPEKIVQVSLERRIRFINPKISLDDFLTAVDSKNKKVLIKYKNNKVFKKLSELYLVAKSIKNRVNRDGTYIDEVTFNKIYEKKRPKNYY